MKFWKSCGNHRFQRSAYLSGFQVLEGDSWKNFVKMKISEKREVDLAGLFTTKFNARSGIAENQEISDVDLGGEFTTEFNVFTFFEEIL